MLQHMTAPRTQLSWCVTPRGVAAAHARRDEPAMRDEDAQQKEEEGEAEPERGRAVVHRAA
eukprot:scaffold118441_cov45-Phaeocystis_antarctica.AAC.1